MVKTISKLILIVVFKFVWLCVLDFHKNRRSLSFLPNCDRCAIQNFIDDLLHPTATVDLFSLLKFLFLSIIQSLDRLQTFKLLNFEIVTESTISFIITLLIANIEQGIWDCLTGVFYWYFFSHLLTPYWWLITYSSNLFALLN